MFSKESFQLRLGQSSELIPMAWKGPAPAPRRWPASGLMFISLAMSRRLNLQSNRGSGNRFGWPPMSAMLSLPERPSAARWNGGFRRSGHSSTVIDAFPKLFSNAGRRTSASSSKDGGDRECVVVCIS